ncbi:hypothetical protein R50073_26120 [Maricurvus nonylphenolicus]|uniref:DUF2835 domain-containing protein n=1 Tax=Maricurvus nonylphenolicus TaxID=1008307 RepID=UPI0036F32197
MLSLVVNLMIPADEYQLMYQGVVKDVVTRAVDGRTVRFPAHILRPFVTHDGVSGRFQIIFDDDHRFQTIKRLD